MTTVQTRSCSNDTCQGPGQEAEEPAGPTHPYCNPASGLHKASSHPTIQPAGILAKVHSLGNLMWGVFAAGMCVAGAQCPSPDSRLCWSPKKACGQMNPESQPLTVPGNGMCCWGVAGRRRGHWVLGKVGAPITRSPLFC